MYKKSITVPIPINSIFLYSEVYYNFILDIIQNLCIQSNTIPTTLDACVFSSFDNGRGEDYFKDNGTYTHKVSMENVNEESNKAYLRYSLDNFTNLFNIPPFFMNEGITQHSSCRMKLYLLYTLQTQHCLNPLTGAGIANRFNH